MTSKGKKLSLGIEAGVLEDDNVGGFELVLRCASLVLQIFSSSAVSPRHIRVRGNVRSVSEVVFGDDEQASTLRKTL